MPYLRPSLLLLLILSVLLSVLILSCDPDEAKKKPSENNTTQDDQDNQDDDQDQNDNNDNQTNKPPKSDKPVTPPNPPKTIKATKPVSTIPVASLDAVSSKTAGNDGGTDASITGWVFQDKEIIFSTTARDKDGNEIPAAQFVWQWRKRGQDTDRGFGRTWTEITGQTTATATLTIPADERVGAYELRVSATSGKKTVDNHKETPYKFTVRKSGCPAPSATNQPADRKALRTLVNGGTLTDKELQAIDTSLVIDMTYLFGMNTSSFSANISCWDVSNVRSIGYIFENSSMFNQDIGDWDTSNIASMPGMFEGASAFNQDLSGWDVSKVTNNIDFANGTSASWTADRKPDFS